MKTDKTPDVILNEVDAQKREFIGRLLGTTAFVAPVVASFAMTTLAASEAHAASNIT
jgi:hypothetical protein